MTRYVTREPHAASVGTPDYPTLDLAWEDVTGKDDPAQRYALYRLCLCEACSGHGQLRDGPFGIPRGVPQRCSQCRGEGRTLQLLATAATPEAAGVALVTLARDGELEECPLGLLDRQPEEGQRKWLVLPWLPSPRNVSDAGRTLARAKKDLDAIRRI